MSPESILKKKSSCSESRTFLGEKNRLWQKRAFDDPEVRLALLKKSVRVALVKKINCWNKPENVFFFTGLFLCSFYVPALLLGEPDSSLK